MGTRRVLARRAGARVGGRVRREGSVWGCGAMGALGRRVPARA